MAKRWLPLVNLQKAAWKIAQQDITRLDAAITLVDECQESFDHNASPSNRAAGGVPQPGDGHALVQDPHLPHPAA